jgi:hypothetical protein
MKYKLGSIKLSLESIVVIILSSFFLILAIIFLKDIFLEKLCLSNWC